MADVAIMLVIAAIGAVVGVGFGIVVLAPRIGRLLDRSDEAASSKEAGRDGTGDGD